MKKILAEYIWLDGNETQKLRSKTKVITTKFDVVSLDNLPLWSYDGSSTLQAGNSHDFEGTDCVLKPVYMVPDPFRGGNNVLVMCEVFNPDGITPHDSNKRAKLRELIKETNIELEQQPWFGWEQEYTLMNKVIPFGKGEGYPLGFGDPNPHAAPREQGDYYCGVGSDSIIGRKIAEEHLQKCLEIGLDISGINSEVLLSQWEYQIGPVDSLHGSDQLWISRYILHRIGEENGVKVSLHPKPLSGEWNGSGCHVNFSTKQMREDENGIDLIYEACNKLAENHKEHIDVYGKFNELRMTGKLETSDINKFSYGISTRDTSVRIPAQSKLDKRGYFEDRRPSSNCDPYLVSKRMLDTVCLPNEELVIN